MDLKTIFSAVFIAAVYVSWPLLPKALKVEPGLNTFIVVMGALAVMLIVGRKDIATIGTISAKALLVILAFAVVNGIALYLYGAIAASKDSQTGIFLVLVFILEVALSPLADRIINGKNLGALQWVGLALAMPVMWLLTQSPKK